MLSNRKVTLLLAFFLILSLGGWINSCKRNKEVVRQYQALDGTLTKTVDKLGRANFELKTLEGSYLDLAKLDLSKDTTLARLQAMIKEKGKRADVRSAVSFQAKTIGKAAGKNTVFAADTTGKIIIRAHVSSPPFRQGEPPTFEGDVTATRDSTWVDPYVIRVGFDIVQTERGRDLITTIRPTDPAINVTSAGSYSRKLSRKNRGLWAAIGAALVVTATTILR